MVSIFAILAVTFFCGCVSQKDLQTQFLKVSDDYYGRYCHAKSREDAISELKDYLAAVDTIQKPQATKVLYSRGRSFAETRLSLIYEQLGDSKNTRIFMDQALRDIQQDPQFDKSLNYDKDAQEASLKRMVVKIDALNSIDWQNTANHDVLSPH